jgi:hypothetical protein
VPRPDGALAPDEDPLEATFGGHVDDAAFYEGPVYGGLDLSLTTDLTALVLIAMKDGVWHVKPVFWTPESTLADRAKKDRTPYDAWVRDGFMKATPGPAVEYNFVARDIAALTEGMDIRKIGFDRHRMKTLQAELDRLDVVLPFEEFGQGFVSMGPAVDRAEIEFLHERFRHGGHPVMTMCAANAIIVEDAAGMMRVDDRRPGLERTVIGDQIIRYIGQIKPDTVALDQPPVHQRCCKCCSLRADLRIGQLCPEKVGERRAATLRNGGVEHLAQSHWRIRRIPLNRMDILATPDS